MLRTVLKPTRASLLLTGALLLLVPLFPLRMPMMDSDPVVQYLPLPYYLVFLADRWTEPVLSPIPLLGVAALYAVSCGIVAGVRRFPVEREVRLREGLRPTRARVVVASLGWLTVPDLVMTWWSGMRGGQVNFTDLEMSLTYAASVPSFFLFPFQMITVLLHGAVVIPLRLLEALVTMGDMPSGPGGPFHPASLAAWEFALVLPLVALLWWAVASGLVAGWQSLRRRFSASPR